MLMAVYRIPLTSTQQEFDIDIGDYTYHIRVYFNKFMPAWCLDLSNENKQPITQGWPLVTGANNLDQLHYRGLGGALVLHTEGDPDHMPGMDELGTTTELYFISEVGDATASV